MASQSSSRTPQSAATDSSTPFSPSKSIQSQSSDYSLWIIEPIPMADTLASPPGQQATTRAARPRGGRPASPLRRSSPARAASPSRSPTSRGNGRIGARTSGRPTIGVLSPRKAIGKRLVPSYFGGHVMQVAALQVVMPKSPEYSPASPSPPRTRVVGREVGHGKELRTPLDREERESIDSNPVSVRRFRSPPPIRGPPEVCAYTDSDDDE